MASKVIKFKVKPNNHITANAVTKEVGMATKTISEFL